MKKLEIPDGMEIDFEKSNIVYKPIQCTWDKIGLIEGYFIDDNSVIWPKDNRVYEHDLCKNTWPTKEEAEAALALSQLCQWRDKYNKGWKPDWNNEDYKYVMYVQGNCINYTTSKKIRRVLTFKTSDICSKFLNDFKDLIEIAKPLI